MLRLIKLCITNVVITARRTGCVWNRLKSKAALILTWAQRENASISFIWVEPVQRSRRGLWQKDAGLSGKTVEPDSAFSVTQHHSVVLRWPVTYMQGHIPGGLLCNLNTVFLSCDRCEEKIVAAVITLCCKILSVSTINHCTVFWHLISP